MSERQWIFGGSFGLLIGCPATKSQLILSAWGARRGTIFPRGQPFRVLVGPKGWARLASDFRALWKGVLTESSFWGTLVWEGVLERGYRILSHWYSRVQVPLVENGYRHPEYYYYGCQAVFLVWSWTEGLSVHLSVHRWWSLKLAYYYIQVYFGL